jgi:hypothetical protein
MTKPVVSSANIEAVNLFEINLTTFELIVQNLSSRRLWSRKQERKRHRRLRQQHWEAHATLLLATTLRFDSWTYVCKQWSQVAHWLLLYEKEFLFIFWYEEYVVQSLLLFHTLTRICYHLISEHVSCVCITRNFAYTFRPSCDFGDWSADMSLDDGPISFFWCDPNFMTRFSLPRVPTRRRQSHCSRTARNVLCIRVGSVVEDSDWVCKDKTRNWWFNCYQFYIITSK